MTEWIVTSTAMILIIIALRGLLKGKITAKLRYSLWALVLVRLLIPFSLVDSAISVSNILSAPVIQEADGAVEDYRESYEAIRQNSAQQGQEVTDDDIRLQVQQQLYNKAYSQIEKEYTQSGTAVTVDRIQTEAQQQVQVISLTAVVMEALPYLWLVGMIAVAAVLAGSNLHFWWKLRQSRKPLEISGVPLNTYLTDYVATPCLFGLAKPDIYLTGEVMSDSQMRRHVLAHEMSHYRQGDHIWSMLRCLCLVLHWYNPLVWVAAVLSKKDAELACDEATIKVLGEAERTAYGRTLIGMTCVRRDPGSLMLTATTMLGTKKTLKERIALIAKKPKTALYTLIACVLVAAIAVGCTFTGAPKSEEEKLLDRCREAVEYIKNLDNFEMIETHELNEVSEDVLGPLAESSRYVYSGDDWYISRSSADRTWEFAQISGEQFQKLTTIAIPEEDNQYSDWVKMEQIESIYFNDPWIMSLSWSDESVENESVSFTPLSVSSYTSGSQEFIRVELTQTGEIQEEVTAWVLTFRFDAYSGEVTELKREIHVLNALEIADGGKNVPQLYSTNTLSIYPGTENEMSDTIESFYHGETDSIAPTDPNGVYAWEPVAHTPVAANDYFTLTPKSVNEVTTWLNWTAADGVSRYQVSYSSGYGIRVEYLEPWSEVWKVPNSEQYGDVALMLCDGVYAYGVRQQTELVRIELKTGSCETIFTADQIMCGFTGDGSCKNIFIMDRDWLFFPARKDGAVRIYRIYLPKLYVKELGCTIPEDTLPHFLKLDYNLNDRNEITCTYLNSELQTVLLNEINDPNSSYRDVTVRVDNETVSLNWVWENKEALRLESTYYWYGPFEYLRVKLQNDRNIPGNRIVVCNNKTEDWLHTYSWIEMIDEEPTEPPTEPATEPTVEPTEPNPEVAKFQELLKDNNNYYYFRAMGVIFEDPEEINLEYLFYNGLLAKDRQDRNEYTDSEVAFLKDYAKNSTWRDESAWVNAHKMPRQYLNDVLVDYFGVTLEDLDIPEEWTYYEETDSYYVIRSDGYGVTGFTVTDVQTDENGLIYVYWTANYIRDTRTEEIKFINEPQMVMVLEEREDGGYRIHLNLPVEELLDTSDEEYFQNLLTSKNGFWYWRAMGCIFENAEDIDMTLLCYGGMEERILYSTFTDDEIEFLKSRYPANGFDDSPWSNAHKLPRQELEAVMQTYFGVSLDDVSIPWVYYVETDAYYHVKYDSYGLVDYTVTDVDYHDDGTVSVYWHVPFGLWDTRDPENEHFLDEADMLLTLKDNGDGTYTVLSNLPV